MSKPVILYIVEGEQRDLFAINQMTQTFFQGRYEAKIISLSAARNIYMLYQLLEKDQFETDIVEIIRDNVPGADEILLGINRQRIDEVYLFFDYDIHQNNLPRDLCLSPHEIIEKMLETFDNETENGKLYISYPMVEAIYDFYDSRCKAFTSCYYPVDKLNEYKTISGTQNPNTNLHFTISQWKMILSVFIIRSQCLFGLEAIDFQLFRQIVTPHSIYSCELNLFQEKHTVFILSGIPEFLLDYFKADFWNSMHKMHHFTDKQCC